MLIFTGLALAIAVLGATLGLHRTIAMASPRSLVQTEVFVAGEGGYHTFRIPSLVVTMKGTLLAFAEGRHASAADSGHIDIVLKRSADGGATWSPLRVIGDNGPDAWVNPCAVVDRRTGTVWLLSTQNRGADKEHDIIARSSGAGITVWALRSHDDGVTWSSVDITASVKKPEWTWYATGPGIGIRRSTRRGPHAHRTSGPGQRRSSLDDRQRWPQPDPLLQPRQQPA